MYKLMMLPLLGILTAGTALAQSAPADSGVAAQQQNRMQVRVDRLASKLGLDANGKSQLEATFAKYRSQRMPVWQDVKSTRQALRAELEGAKDASKLTSLTAQLTSDRQKLASLRTTEMGELQSQLTPAQYAQLVVARHGRGHGGHRFHGQRPAGEQ